ncbi:hypothetical protein C8R43DRAFT_1241137 [Mycena crocata]|nr:hypothetical protein C8R43DRAFT_1241137 [Mycena crocata]
MMQHLGPETALMGRGTFRIFAAGGWLEANIPVELQSSVSTQTLVYHAFRKSLHGDSVMYGTADEDSAHRVELHNFAAGGQHPATTSKYRISPTASISRPPASRRVAAAEAITRRIEIPRAGLTSNFCRRRPTPRYDFKAPYFRNRQHLPCTREPPRSGGGSKYATYPNPARGLKFHFLPPEANAPLRLESNISP